MTELSGFPKFATSTVSGNGHTGGYFLRLKRSLLSLSSQMGPSKAIPGTFSLKTRCDVTTVRIFFGSSVSEEIHPRFIRSGDAASCNML